MSILRRLRSFSICLALTLGTLAAAAQNAGVYPFQSVDTESFDQVDLSDGLVRFSIPIVSKSGRGLPFNFSLNYTGLVWTPQTANGQTTWTPDPNWGWVKSDATQFLGSYSTIVGSVDVPDGPTKHHQPKPPADCTQTTTNVTYTDPSGAAHFFSNGGTDCNGKALPARNLATDNSGWQMLTPSSFMSKSGIIYNPPAGAGMQGSLADSNGNQITTTDGLTFTDTLGITVLQITGSPASGTMRYTYQTANGGPTAATVVTYRSYNVQTYFGTNYQVPYAQYNQTAQLVDTVTLADGTFYHFTYEPSDCTPACPGAVTGRIAQVTLPSTATISYSYKDPTQSQPPILPDGTLAYLSRTSALGSKTFVHTYSGTTVTDALGNTTETYTADTDNTQLFLTERVTPTSDTIVCYNVTYANCAPGNQTFTYPITSRVTISQPGYNSPPHATEEDYDGFGNTTKLLEYAQGYFDEFINLQRQTITHYAPLTGGAPNKPASVEVQDGAGNRAAYTTYAYDESVPVSTSGLPKHVTPTGARGNLTTVSRWVGAAQSTPSYTIPTVMTYDDAGQVQTVSTNGSPVTTVTYDAYDAFPTQVTRPRTATNHISSTNYEPYAGKLVSSTDENGQTTSYYQDTMLRPTDVYTPDGGHQGTSYTATSATTTTLLHDSVNASVTYNADASGHLGSIVQAAPNCSIEVDYSYNVRGQKASVSNPYQTCNPSSTEGSTTLTYDASGQVTSVVKQDGSKSTSSVSNGVQITTDERLIQYQKTYDGLGRLIAVQEPDQWITSYEYDALNNIIEIDQTGGSPDISSWQIRRFQYDSLSRLLHENTPEAGDKYYLYTATASSTNLCSYDPSNVCSTVDNNGESTVMTYDVLNRLTSVTNPDQDTSTYTYDSITMLDGTTASNAIGRMVKMQRDDTMREMSYDAMGRVTKLLNVLPSDVPSQTYETMLSTYDVAGEQTSLTYPSGRKVSFSYDTVGRLLGTNLASFNGQNPNTSYVSGMTYTPTGALTGQLFGNQIQQNLTYNNRAQITRNQYISNLNSNTVADKSFTWADFNGHNSGLIWGITDNVDPSLSTTYSYDNENRIASAASGTYSQTYHYDPFGNQTQTGSFAYDPSNGSGQPYNAGNQPANTIVDPLGNLSPTTQLSFSGNLITNYAALGTGPYQPDPNSLYVYDAANMRAQVTMPGGHWRETLYLGNTLLAERTDANSGAWTDIIYAGGQRIALELPNGKTRYHITDHLGSTLGVTGPQDNIVSLTEMTPYGHVVSDGGNTNLLFTGKERDPETGLDYFGGRYYSSTMNRFISPDPMGLGASNLSNPQSLNLYSYVVHNPLMYSDPTGFECMDNPAGPPGTTQDCSGPDGPVSLLDGSGLDDKPSNRQPQWDEDEDDDLRMGGDSSVLLLADPQNSPAVAPSNPPLYCNANVISAMGKIWAQSGNGTSGAEASFRLDGTPSNYNIVFSPFTNQRSSQSLTIRPGTTFALFHVHPNTGSWQPSTPQNNYEGNGLGDTGVADKFTLQMYVVSRAGLGLYDPTTKGPSTLVRPGMSWTKPCP